MSIPGPGIFTGRDTLEICGYTITQTLSESKRIIVYRATHNNSGNVAVLKLSNRPYPTPSDLARIRHEFDIGTLFNHNKIVTLIGLEEFQRNLVLIREYVEGFSLAQISRVKSTNIIWLLDLAVQITEGLHEVHRHQVILKNLCPSNILYSRDTGNIKLIDFSVGTTAEKEYPFHLPNLIPASRLFYISPEQTGRVNRALDFRTDFYSLGATLYELLTGTLPFETTDPIEQVHCHLARQPIPPHKHNPLITHDLSKIILKLLEKSPDNRYQSCEELQPDLLGCLRKLKKTSPTKNVSAPDIALSDRSTPAETFQDSGTIALSEDNRNLGMMSIIRASRAFTGEIFLDELLKKVMVILLENAGGQRGFLLMQTQGDWKVKVKAQVGDRRGGIIIDDAPGTRHLQIEQTIIDDAVNSRKTVVFNNTTILANKPNSILCMPIMYQEEILCLIYLENSLTTSAFHSGRLEVLNLLASQAAHSIRNARLYEELEKTVSELHQEAEKHKKTQIQLLHAGKLSALSRLSASIAHEFGNPLIGIKYLLDDLRTRTELSNEDKHLIDAGLQECEHMGNLIRDLHDLRRPSSGTKKQFNLNDTIKNVLSFQKSNLTKTGIKVETELDSELPRIEAVEDQIAQVIVNLSMNAADAMKDRGGKLLVRTTRQNGRVVMSITDSGCGISLEHQERVFEPFFSTKKETDGTGLGLAIAYSIVKNHGGEIRFTSESEKGTTFTISLPV